MDLLTNAVESIQAGVEDYQEASRPRLLSAVRNIHAGILLLYKEALLRCSPVGSNEVLIKARLEPRLESNGNVMFVGVGKKTVDVQQIKDRFEGLRIDTDWKAFDRITQLRNDVEHYYPRISQDAISAAVATAFLLIKRFAAVQLREEPRTLLGQDTWDVMLQASEVYQEERSACDSALAAVSWESTTLEEGVRLVHCAECGSDLLIPTGGSHFYDASLECRSCGNVHAPESFIPAAVAEALAGDAYIAATDGAEEPYSECPECGLETYVFEEGQCVACGESAETECSRCGHNIPASEMSSSPICGWCAHMTSKDD